MKNESREVHTVRLMGGIEISHSLTTLPRKARADIIGAAIQRLLGRYGRTNYHVLQSTCLIEKYLGFSPMWQCNNELGEVKVSWAYIYIILKFV